MPRRMLASFAAALLALSSPPVWPHQCRVLGNGYLTGDYEGDCDEHTERAQGRGEARGADTYVGSFARGRPDGIGTYTWANGATLVGSFKDGKAQGAGVYISAHGVRYEGQFVGGRLDGLHGADCPVTQGPVGC